MFVYKTEKEISELSEYQREKYFDQKAQYEKDQAKEIADKAAKDAVAEALKDVDSKIEDAKKSAKEEALQEAKAALEWCVEQGGGPVYNEKDFSKIYTVVAVGSYAE